MAFSDIVVLVFISRGRLVLEHPIRVAERSSGKSKIKLYDAIDTMIEIINIAVFFKPLRVFLPISMVFAFSGIVWGIPILLMGRGVSTGSSLLILLGVVVMLLGKHLRAAFDDP